jgi:hypothetical protein
MMLVEVSFNLHYLVFIEKIYDIVLTIVNFNMQVLAGHKWALQSEITIVTNSRCILAY